MEPSNPPQVVAFFDLDRTLIHPNSATLYARHEYRLGRISRWQLARSLFYTLLYHLSMVDMNRAFGMVLSHYRGLPEQEMVERTHRWFEAEIAHLLLPGARQALLGHRAEGHLRVLLTSSSSYMSRLAVERWGLDDWIANRFPVDDGGRLTGEMVRPICYGAGKVTHAERWAQSRPIAWDASYFYSDSLSDLPMLERVGHPRVVNPDPRLRRLAGRRGWPILDWRNPKSGSPPSPA